MFTEVSNKPIYFNMRKKLRCRQIPYTLLQIMYLWIVFSSPLGNCRKKSIGLSAKYGTIISLKSPIQGLLEESYSYSADFDTAALSLLKTILAAK